MQNKLRLWVLTSYLTIRKIFLNLDQYIQNARYSAEQEAHNKLAVNELIHRNNIDMAAVIEDNHSQEDYNDVFIPPQSDIVVEGDGYIVHVTNTSHTDKTMNWCMRHRADVRVRNLIPPTFDENSGCAHCMGINEQPDSRCQCECH